MDSVEVYTFEDADGAPDSYTTYDPQEAKERAEKYGLKVIALSFEYADSELVWDFTAETAPA